MKIVSIIFICLAIVGCNGISTTAPTSTVIITTTPSATITPTPTITITLTPLATNTSLPLTKDECIHVSWPNLASDLKTFVGKCIYLEGRVISFATPAELSNRPADEGMLVIRPPDPNDKNLFLEATLHGDQDFFSSLKSMISTEQGWIAIWGMFQDERNNINPRNPSPATGYLLDGYMLYAENEEALSSCLINQVRTNEGICAEAIPTPDPLHNDKSDGFYLVGVDIAPGVWRSSGTGNTCYWATTTRTGIIINNHFGMAGGTAYISSTVFQVEFRDCGTWKFLGPP